MSHGSRLFSVGLHLVQFFSRLPDRISFLKAQIVSEAVTTNSNFHISGCILCRASTKPVEPQSETVVSTVDIVIILTSGIELTIYQLPVPTLFPAVPVQRASAAEILNLYGFVLIIREGNKITKAFACFIDRVGKNLKNCVFTSVQSV